MFDVNILDVIQLLGIELPADGKRNYNVSCPVCDGNKKGKKHLNINLEKNVYSCPRCECNGGTLSLYCLYTGMSDTPENRKEAYKKIKSGLGECVPIVHKYTPPRNKQNKIADINVLDNTYSEMLSLLGLSKKHMQNLLNRGLSKEDIIRLGYKSAPTKNTEKLCQILQEKGCQLQGVPGFWQKKSGKWTIGAEEGILIPFRDFQGRIQGCQKRLDNAESGRKFRWLSSTDLPNGTKTENWIHIVGNLDAKTIVLTEGGMKADVINALSGRTVVAVPGVNAIQKLRDILEKLQKEYNLEVVQTAFDMDFISNKFVEKAYNNLTNMLEEAGIKYHKLMWNEQYKGLDDYLKYKLIDAKK